MKEEKLSIIIPVFNEEKTVAELIAKVKGINFGGLGLKSEIIVVDDGSTDKSREILSEITGIKLLFHRKNMGKGAAVRTGIENSTGSIIIIQDADLEYDPVQIPEVIKPILEGQADVVYGSRFIGNIKGAKIALHETGNKILSMITTLLYFSRVTDMETCYKAFRREVLDGIKLRSNGFDFEPEITAKILKKGAGISEVPITSFARTFSEGKKITVKDGFKALKALIYYRFFN